jgi:hypothetical protein
MQGDRHIGAARGFEHVRVGHFGSGHHVPDLVSFSDAARSSLRCRAPMLFSGREACAISYTGAFTCQPEGHHGKRGTPATGRRAGDRRRDPFRPHAGHQPHLIIAKFLGALGIDLREARVVPDIEDEIVAAVNALRPATPMSSPPAASGRPMTTSPRIRSPRRSASASTTIPRRWRCWAPATSPANSTRCASAWRAFPTARP